MKKSLGARVVPVSAPVWLVGTYDDAGRANAATVAWAGICCSNPPCVNFSLRKATHSYAAVLARGAFTVSVPSATQAEAADYFGLASGRDFDKFRVAGFTATRAGTVNAPYVEECPLVFECRLAHHADLGLHTLFVGEVLEVRCEEGVLGPDGLPNPVRMAPLIFAAGEYRALGKILGRAHSIGRAVGPVKKDA